MILDNLQQSFTRHLEAMQAELSGSEQQLVAQLALWNQALQASEVELEKALRNLPAMAGKSGPGGRGNLPTLDAGD